MMLTPAAFQKRQDLMNFIERELAPEPAVQAVIGIGSLATGLARPGSDIDAIIFLEPFDPYIVPAEFQWRPADGSFHSIFSQDGGLEAESIQFDFTRLDLAQWAAAGFDWPEPRRAELSEGWLAYDRSGVVARLIVERTAYPEQTRLAKLDEALTWLDQHLSGNGPERRWDQLGPIIAHSRLQAAYDYLAQGLFAYNRRWRTWRNREMSSLLTLTWLPENFDQRILTAMNAPSSDYPGYLARLEELRALFQELLNRLISDGDYTKAAIEEAFIRRHQEPGRAWNMAEWNQKHRERAAKDKQIKQPDPKPIIMVEEWGETHPRWPELVEFIAGQHQTSWVNFKADFHHSSHLLVAQQGEAIMGFLRFVIQDIGPDMDCPPVTLNGVILTEAKVLAFGVDPAYRRQGIGRALQEELLRQAKQRGCHQLRSHSGGQNEANHQLKLGLGFGVHPIIRGEDTKGVYFVMPLKINRNYASLLIDPEAGE
jgi:ribosomal protein S18 acetylase RimI-like enzyme